MVHSSGQGIWFLHAPARLVVQREVKVGEVEEPPGLSVLELLSCLEVFKVLVICPDLELVLCTFQEVPPLLKQPDDGQHFLVMDLIVLLHCIQALRVKGHWMPLPILQRLLQEHSSSGKVRAVGFYSEERVVVWKEENRSGGHGILESVKGHLLQRSPTLYNILSSELEVELVLAEALQDEVSDLMVFLQYFGIDEDVVKVYTHYAFCYEVPEDVVHHGLKGGRAISESKEYNKQL
ncbi:hypothetical protein C0989_012070 [Termitomyces sp. Mn162]|nr:hypothetical protein C0989_012070 [Termitomyces sp. Mn162]